MSVKVIAFTSIGAALAARLCVLFPEAEASVPERYAVPPVSPLRRSLEEWTKENFQTGNALIFVGAAGIAVRAVAPFVRSKDVDPAVLCADESGRYVIPLLSGHLGGANSLALEFAAALGATAVITTATDLRGVFSPDAWASRNHFAVADPAQIKQISAALLEGEPVGFCSEFPVSGPLPKGVAEGIHFRCGIEIAFRSKAPFSHTLHFVPRCVTAGIGCRKGIEADTLERRLREDLEIQNIPLCAVEGIATIDRKQNEPGLRQLCDRLTVKLNAFTAIELMRAAGSFTASERVLQETGTDNVCERAAVLAGGRLISRKTASDGVTIALTVREPVISFEQEGKA